MLGGTDKDVKTRIGEARAALIQNCPNASRIGFLTREKSQVYTLWCRDMKDN